MYVCEYTPIVRFLMPSTLRTIASTAAKSRSCAVWGCDTNTPTPPLASGSHSTFCCCVFVFLQHCFVALVYVLLCDSSNFIIPAFFITAHPLFRYQIHFVTHSPLRTTTAIREALVNARKLNSYYNSFNSTLCRRASLLFAHAQLLAPTPLEIRVYMLFGFMRFFYFFVWDFSINWNLKFL